MNARLFRFVAGLAFVLPAAGWACSPAPGYRVPTNFELVERADLIVIAQVDAGSEGSIAGADPSGPVVRIGPMQVLKGVLPREPLTLAGMVSSPDGVAFEASPTPLGAAHPSVLAGGCTRQHYAKGSLVLAMYERRDGGLRPIDAPFARAVEDVESYDSLWVRAARRYVELQRRAPGAARRAAVLTERDRLRARESDMAAQAIAADLDMWLEGGARRTAGWRYDDEADAVAIFTGGATGTEPVSLSCRRNGAAIELAGGRALTIGDRRFAAEEGRIGFTPELRQLLEHSAGPFAVDTHRGGGGDLFQKFALRCEALLDR